MNEGGYFLVSATREIQPLLLSAMLAGGCAAKAKRVISARSIAVASSPTVMFPLRLRRPATIILCASEFGLGIGLTVTIFRFGTGAPATTVRVAAALLFLTSVGVLHELRGRRPDTGCGCFGDLSDTPVGLRTITRSAALCLASVAAVGAPPLRFPSGPERIGVVAALVIAELTIIALLSPELGQVLVRLGYSEPCEVRRLPIERTVAALRGTAQWRRYRRIVSAPEPADVWREGCWRYLVFPATVDGRRVELVFAVYMKARRPPVRTAVLDAVSGEVLAGAGARTSIAAPRLRARHLAAPHGGPPARHKASANF